MKSTIKLIESVVIATGISSVTAQLIIVREFLALFSGNEFVIALILFNWLVSGGIGSLLANLMRKRAGGMTTTGSFLGVLSLMLSVLPIILIVSIRLFHNLLFIHGTSTGFYQTFAFTFFTTAPYALLIGFALPFSLYVVRNHSPEYKGAWIYITDNIGDVTGGMLFSFLLVYLVSPFTALILSGIPLCIVSFFLFDSVKRFSVAAGIVLAATVFIAAPMIETKTLRPPYGELIHYKESKYGRITVQDDSGQYTLYSDGTPVFTSLNLVAAEEAVHYPLSQVKQAKNILLVSTESGMMEQIHKYNPRNVDYVEIDPEITSALVRFNLIKMIPSLNIIHQDARKFLRATDTIYDAVIISLPEPETFQINRFFTEEFFRLVKTRLGEAGIMSFSLAGYDNYLADARRSKVSSVYNTVSRCFSNISMIPGNRIIFLCGSKPINTSIPALLEAKGVQTSYIKGYFHGNITERRMDYLNSMVDRSAPVNRDTSPGLMKLMFSQWFEKHNTSPDLFAVMISVVFAVFITILSKEEFLLFTTGFVTMGSEFLVIFAFQIFFGYIYLQIGIIVTVFLAGLLPGAWFSSAWGRKFRERSVLLFTDILIIALMVVFILTMKTGVLKNSVMFYLCFGFAISLLCGFQFPAAIASSQDKGSAVTRAFSADLAGAAFGVLITSVVLLPFTDITKTAMALALLKILSFTMMVFHGRVRSRG